MDHSQYQREIIGIESCIPYGKNVDREDIIADKLSYPAKYYVVRTFPDDSLSKKILSKYKIFKEGDAIRVVGVSNPKKSLGFIKEIHSYSAFIKTIGGWEVNVPFNRLSCGKKFITPLGKVMYK